MAQAAAPKVARPAPTTMAVQRRAAFRRQRRRTSRITRRSSSKRVVLMAPSPARRTCGRQAVRKDRLRREEDERRGQGVAPERLAALLILGGREGDRRR